MTVAAQNDQVALIRDASRRLVREFGFMKTTLAGTSLPPSAVHALVEIGAAGSLTSVELSDILALDKSSVSRMVRKLVESEQLAETVSRSDRRARPLSLTAKGRATLAAIDRFARDQVVAALGKLTPEACSAVLAGLASYAGALTASRTGKPGRDPGGFVVERGYRPGVMGRAVEMHARYYGREFGFGRFFERKVAADLAEFAGRLDHAGNALWVATRAGAIIGTIAIDGQDIGPDAAHLRWFIVEDGLRGGGIGRALLAEAIDFCDRQGFAEIRLWTFRGLDAARRLYESRGFALVEEMPGRQWGSEIIEQKFVRRIAGAGIDKP